MDSILLEGLFLVSFEWLYRLRPFNRGENYSRQRKNFGLRKPTA